MGSVYFCKNPHKISLKSVSSGRRLFRMDIHTDKPADHRKDIAKLQLLFAMSCNYI